MKVPGKEREDVLIYGVKVTYLKSKNKIKKEVLDLLNPSKEDQDEEEKEEEEEEKEEKEKEENEENEKEEKGEENEETEKGEQNEEQESFNDLHISTDSEAEANRVRIKHKKSEIKYRLPELARWTMVY